MRERNPPCEIPVKSVGASVCGTREGRERGNLERGGDEMNMLEREERQKARE